MIPIAFYAPLKSPDHAVPSGDRTMGRLLVDALRLAGFDPTLASRLRSLDLAGDARTQERIRAQGEAEAARLVTDFRARPPALRPRLWFTYHCYYKAPDWIGPRVAAALGIPYVVAEGSRSSRRAEGAWAIGHAGAEAALDRADCLFVMTEADAEDLEPALRPGQSLVALPPFLDAGLWGLGPDVTAPLHHADLTAATSQWAPRDSGGAASSPPPHGLRHSHTSIYEVDDCLPPCGEGGPSEAEGRMGVHPRTPHVEQTAPPPPRPNASLSLGPPHKGEGGREPSAEICESGSPQGEGDHAHDGGGGRPTHASTRCEAPVHLLAVAMMRAGDKLASYRLLAEALSLLPRDAAWTLDIVGDGPARGAVSALFAAFGPRVRLLGAIAEPDQLARAYRVADLLVWPAVGEAYGMTLLEAQACGCPLLAGREAGVSAVVRDGETGILVARRDPTALADALGALLGDRGRLVTLGEAARAFVLGERDLGHAATILRAALAPLVDRAAPERSRAAS